MTVPNGAPLLVRQGFNNALAALNSLNSGPTAPGDPVAFQFWADTTTGKLKVRNAANNAWVDVYDLWESPLPISKGGHGATTLAGAKTALQLVSYEAQTLTSGQQAQARENIGLGSAATRDTGTSGGVVPLLNTGNTWSAAQTYERGNGLVGLTGLLTGRNTSGGATNTAPSFRATISQGAQEALFTCREVVGTFTAAMVITRLNETFANYRFASTGTALAENGTWQNSSDVRVKELDDPIEDPVSKLFELHGRTWTRKDNGTRGIGLVAEDVQRIFPDQVLESGVVAKDQEGNVLTENMLAIDTAGVGVAVLVEALKVAIRRIEALEAQLA